MAYAESQTVNQKLGNLRFCSPISERTVIGRNPKRGRKSGLSRNQKCPHLYLKGINPILKISDFLLLPSITFLHHMRRFLTMRDMFINTMFSSTFSPSLLLSAWVYHVFNLTSTEYTTCSTCQVQSISHVQPNKYRVQHVFNLTITVYTTCSIWQVQSIPHVQPNKYRLHHVFNLTSTEYTTCSTWQVQSTLRVQPDKYRVHHLFKLTSTEYTTCST